MGWYDFVAVTTESTERKPQITKSWKMSQLPPKPPAATDSRRQSITIDDTEFSLDTEMLTGLFSFKDLLQRKLIPANFQDSKKTKEQNKEDEEKYNLQVYSTHTTSS